MADVAMNAPQFSPPATRKILVSINGEETEEKAGRTGIASIDAHVRQSVNPLVRRVVKDTWKRVMNRPFQPMKRLVECHLRLRDVVVGGGSEGFRLLQIVVEGVPAPVVRVVAERRPRILLDLRLADHVKTWKRRERSIRCLLTESGKLTVDSGRATEDLAAVEGEGGVSKEAARAKREMKRTEARK
jgi:hypothetical protein